MRIMMAILYTLATVCVAMSGYMPNLPLTDLTYGALLGVCIGLVDPAVLALPSHYFIEKRNIAYGIVFAGCPIGAILFPIFFVTSDEYVGFRGSMLLYSGIWLQCLLIPAIVWPLDKPKDAQSLKINLDGSTKRGSEKRQRLIMDPHIHDVKDYNSICSNQDGSMTELLLESESSEPSREGLRITTERAELKSNKYTTCCSETLNIFRDYKSFLSTPKLPFLMFSLFFGVAGYVNSLFIIPPLANELGLSKLETSTILVMASVVEIVSKLVVGLMVDRCHISKRTILLPSYAITGTAGLIVSFMQNSYALYGYGVVFGAFGGCVLGLTIPMMIDIVGDEKKGRAAGMIPLFVGTGLAIGPIILGLMAEFSGSSRPGLRMCACAYLVRILCYLATYWSSKLAEHPS